MKKRWLLPLLAAIMCLWFAAAGAQTLPGVDCFSPGLSRVAQAMEAGALVRVQAGAGVGNAFYARDLSLLSKMLEGTTVTCEGAGSETDGYDSLTLARNGQTLLSGKLRYAEGGAELTLNGETFAVRDAGTALAALTGCEALEQSLPQVSLPDLSGQSIVERVPLTRIEAWLTSLEAGDAFIGDFAVAEPFTLERTMSDDGTRLTRLDMSASIARAGEAPYRIQGFVRQAAGRAPKETIELTVTRDEDNFLEISYSSTRQSEITRKDKAGEARVDSSLKLAGKRAGNRFSSRLTVRMTNDWTADGGELAEKIAVTATLTHQDKTPGIRMLRLNEVEGKIKQTLRLTTREEDGPESVYALTDDVTTDIQMDGNTFLAGSLALSIAVDGGVQTGTDRAEATAGEATERQWADAGDIADAARRAARELAARLTAQLDENAWEKIEKGL